MGETKSLYPEVNFSAKAEYGVEVPKYENHSVYGGDFKGEPAKRPDIIILQPDYDDILAGPFIDPLLMDSQIEKQADPTKFRKADDLYEEFTTKYPNLKEKALEGKIDQSKISNEYTDLGKTVYQMSFCKAEEKKVESLPKQREEVLKLPEDWVIRPSIQSTNFRDLTKMQSQGLLSFEVGSKPFKPPPNSLGFTAEEHKILQTTTGESDYQEFIGTSGSDILKEAFYGEIKPLPREYRMPKADK